LHRPARERIATLTEEKDGVRIRRFRVRHFPFDQLLLRSAAHAIPALASRVDAPHVIVPGLYRHLARTRDAYDIVHAGVFPHTALVAAAMACSRRLGVPFVCQPLLNLGEHDRARDNPRFLNPKQLRLLHDADAILTNTTFENEVLESRGIPAEKIVVASPGVTPDEVAGGDGESFRQRHGIAGPIVLQLSTQAFDKGSADTIAAMQRVWARGMDATLVLIGQVLSELTPFLAQLPAPVRERIRVLGYVDEQEKKNALAACDVFVMPSRADSFGIVYLEAWLYRKPVIGCIAGGVPRVITDGETGMLVPFGAVAMLAERLAALLADPSQCARLGEAGRRTVFERYTWDRTYPRVAEVYDALTGGAGR
jgi:glycosyltransferase involved in cell wall biosynthesis